MSMREALSGLTRIVGVRGALLVSLEDGLVVAEALMEGVDGPAVAALAASLAARMRGVTRALLQPDPTLIHLEAAEGGLLATYAPEGLLVVAVTGRDVNVGEARLALRRAAEAGL